MNFSNIVLLRVVGFEAIVVLLAMMIDLAAGIHKAKLNGEPITSDGWKRTVMKFIIYEGGLLIGAFLDASLQASHFWEIFGLEKMVNVPIFATIVTAYLLVVEWWSVREKADVKKRRKEEAIMKALINAAGTDKMQNLLKQIKAETDKIKEFENGED